VSFGLVSSPVCVHSSDIVQSKLQLYARPVIVWFHDGLPWIA